jgi:hypothetical protein
MLSLAAVLESYLRQSNLSQAGRFVVAAGTLLFWVSYFGAAALRLKNGKLSRALVAQSALSTGPATWQAEMQRGG